LLVQKRDFCRYCVDKRDGKSVYGVPVREVEMLSKRRCPHTGVVNFFFAADPHFAVGSVVKAERSGYLWRCYTDPCTSTGTVADIKTAERRVAELCRQAAACQNEAHFVHAA
jgi:hypothetical protein